MIKRTLVFSTVFLLSALAFAQPAPARQTRFANRLLDDVVEMTRAGLADETIVAYVQARRSRLDADTTAGDLIQLRRAGVSESVVRSIASLTGLSDAEGAVSRDVRSESGEDVAYPDEPVSDGYGYAYPYGYPYWYAYSPWFSGEVVIGGFGFRGGHFRHRGFGHGHFGGGRGHGGGHGGGHRGGGRR